MKDGSWTHIYGIAGAVPGVISLVVAWRVESPWSEYLLMASGWFAALVYAALLLKAISNSNNLAERCGKAETEYERSKGDIDVLQKRHDDEMMRRAATLDYLAGVAMTQQAMPRARAIKGKPDDN